MISSKNFHRKSYQATADHNNFLDSLFVLGHVGHNYQLTEQRITRLGTSNMAAVSEEASSKKIVIVGGGLVISIYLLFIVCFDSKFLISLVSLVVFQRYF